MNKSFLSQFLLVLVLVNALLAFNDKARAEERLISVNGSAEKSLDPNMVSMNVEVWSKASTAKQAQQSAAKQYKQVKKTFEEFKIKGEDIQTVSYFLNPEYVYDTKTQQNKMVGFRVVNTLTVTLHKVDEAGIFLDAVVSSEKSADKSVDSGVNVNSLNWDSDQRSKAEISALADAVRAARLKADEIAKAAGVKIKNVARISHGSHMDRPLPITRGFALKAASVSDAAPTELSTGQIKVRVDVTAEYDIN